MNQRFQPLYRYVLAHPLISSLIAQEQQTNGSLRDLIFLADYPPDEPPGTGTVAVYRLSNNVDGTLVQPAVQIMQSKIWFIEDEDWRIDRLQPSSRPAPERFYALAMFHPEYRPQCYISEDRPLFKMRVNDLPVLLSFSQRQSTAKQLTLLG